LGVGGGARSTIERESERKRERERERERASENKRETKTETGRESKREQERGRGREREGEREGERERVWSSFLPLLVERAPGLERAPSLSLPPLPLLVGRANLAGGGLGDASFLEEYHLVSAFKFRA